jgi:hypothetical protein
MMESYTLSCAPYVSAGYIFNKPNQRKKESE